MMHILVFGYSGQVATELRALDGGDLHITALDRAAADLTNPNACAAAIEAHAPDAVFNAAAYTAVDKAEEDEVTAHTVNADAPAAMARTCALRQIPFVSISTDYVFSGAGDVPWTPEHRPDPQGAYGRTKLAGERGIAAAGGRWAVLRTSWVVSAHGNNFVKTMLRLSAERDALNVVADQIGGPTGASEIANACVVIARKLLKDADVSGIYHFAGAPAISWADFARMIFANAGLTCSVTDIPTNAYPTPATRPLNSRMDCSATTTTFGIKQPQWRDSLKTILADLENESHLL